MTNRLVLPILAALAMSVGWGYRGDYGHESGAMVPGALLGLAVALAAGRRDWWERASLLGFLGAIGWAFGGQVSYGRVIGYTSTDSWPDVAYGFACLFVIGGLWGGIGCGILAMGVTRARSELERFAGPLVAPYAVWWGLYFTGWPGWLHERYSMHDTDWVEATAALAVALAYGLAAPKARHACGLIATLAIGWWVGLGVLTLGLGLRMTPPRSDNWAGAVGLLVALVLWQARSKDRAALWLIGVGTLAGGVGFAVGDLANMLGRAKWGPIGASDTLRVLDSWKWMEQGFGLIMGLGVGLGFARVARAPLAPPVEDAPSGPLRLIAPLFLLGPMLWESLWKTVRRWAQLGTLDAGLFGVGPTWWTLLVGLSVTAVVAFAVVRAHRGQLPMAPASAFGRAQLLFLMLLWVPVVGALLQALPGMGRAGTLFVHTTFWLTAAAASAVVIGLNPRPEALAEPGGHPPIPADSSAWWPIRPAIAVAVVGPLLGLLLGTIAVAAEDGPLNGAQRRFEAAPSAAPPTSP